MSSDYLDIAYNSDPLQDEMQPHGVLPFCNSEIYTRSIKQHRLLTSGEDVKAVYDISIDTADVDHEFHPGDAIGVLAHNNKEEVDELMDILELKDVNYGLSILKETTKKKAMIPAHIPQQGSIRRLLEECLDIRSTPKKAFLKMLSQYTTNPDEKQQLFEMGTPKVASYDKFIANEGRTLRTLLRSFPSCKPPLARLLEHLPALKPRFYSVSLITPQSLNITFSVIEYNDEDNLEGENIPQGPRLKGVCSSYLEQLLLQTQENRKIRFYFRQPTNFLTFEPSFDRPLVLIGPGTGVAPFRGFLQSHSLQNSKIYLLFGCRYNERDFLYQEELNDCVEKGKLTELIVAFSRDGDKKVYVQDKIREKGGLIVDLLVNENACLRVCGDAKRLSQAVEEALKEALAQYGGRDEKESEEFLKEMKLSGRYALDVWV